MKASAVQETVDKAKDFTETLSERWESECKHEDWDDYIHQAMKFCVDNNLGYISFTNKNNITTFTFTHFLLKRVIIVGPNSVTVHSFLI